MCAYSLSVDYYSISPPALDVFAGNWCNLSKQFFKLLKQFFLDAFKLNNILIFDSFSVLCVRYTKRIG